MPSESHSLTSRAADLVARYYLKKPDQAELLKIKFPDSSSLGWGVLNEAAYLARSTRSARLTTLNIEVTNRCNLRCVYCPVNRSMVREKTDLPFELFAELLERTPTLRTLLPFQWGEPLLHPRIFEMLRLASTKGIRTYVTTNGTRLDRSERDQILQSGLQRLTVSVDGDDQVHLRTRGVELAPIRERVLALRRERDLSGSALRIDVSMVVDESTAASIDAFLAAWSPVADRVQLIPRLMQAERTKPCREPWRGLLVVLADGRVTACCGDPEGELDLGNIRDCDPAEIFNGLRLRKLRKLHATGEFPPVCRGCGEYTHERVSPRFG